MRTTREGWVAVDVSDEMLDGAHRMRAERDARYGNRYEKLANDSRWVGDLGEIVCNQWLWTVAAGGFEWIVEDPDGQPDFIVHGRSVDVKAIARSVPFRRGYGCSVPAEDVEEPKADFFLFASLHRAGRVIVFVGGIAARHFRPAALFYGPGELVPDGKWRVAPDSEGVWILAEGRLTRPHPWLFGLENGVAA